MALYHVYNWRGGMNEILHPQLLAENQSQLLIDADVTSGKIRAIKHPQNLNISSPMELLHFGTRDRSVVKWSERYYWSDNVLLRYGGNLEPLGIPYPENFFTIGKYNDASEVSGLTGKYKYAVTFVNKNGWESAPGSAAQYYLEINLLNDYAALSFNELPKGIKYVKIYRTMADGADFFCVGQTSNTDKVFIDRMDDITASVQPVLNTFDDFPPPKNGRYLTEAGGVFFLAVESRLYFSKLGHPHAWPVTNFVDIGDRITGICADFQGVLVFSQNNVYRVIGADIPESLTKINIPGNQGCVNYRSISHLANLPVWLSNDGICVWDGNKINIISMQIINTHRLSVKCAASANDVYYLFLDNGAICYDSRNGGIFYRLSFSCDYAWYDGNNDKFYLQKNDGVYLFGEGEEKTYTYKSPQIGDSSLVYKKIFEVLINAEGKFNLTVIADDISVCSIDIKKAGRHCIKMPYPTTARKVELKITGEKGLDEVSMSYV